MSGSSSSTSDQRIIEAETKYLRLHLGLGERPGMPVSSTPPAIQPLFFIELTPPSSRNGAACKLPTCSDRIKPGDYRLVLTPGMSSAHWSQSYGQSAGEPNLQKSVGGSISEESPVVAKRSID